MNIILLGPPGAGKGTQSTILEKDYKLERISTGDLVRAEIAQQSYLGNSIKKTVESGGYPSDQVIMDIVAKKLTTEETGRIFDGIPRTHTQAEILDNLLVNLNQKVDAVILINIDEKELLERITTRYNCAKCGQIYNKFVKPKVFEQCDYCHSHDFVHRADDNIETLNARLQVYNEQTKPLIDYYQKKGIFHAINGLEEITIVSKQIQDVLKTILAYDKDK